ncbi:D-2-hydroxyacid dehydrogenase family protein [Leptospira langatensis]|uniref:D-2-hydroxyacid dehydrogenase family protein n=1 Tax=Leptospira langatensis TaxID=2484983 RepID=A0A5F1ZU43_9LEPT|nr:NAD(P)-dependent oxidoreductase [Leptospira langatensis]TGJ98942.1 D-2-hydroxyacid dehydrogenase family protein [Leptospira langatensis]TGL40489.1 D-2-hydroxyacid dehydrogenase family protein [Leptospira langatensis]
MKPLLLVLDDWEGRIESSSVWKGLTDQIDIHFLKESILSSNYERIREAEFLMAIRERTTLSEEVFGLLPKLKLILQTGGHAYHLDKDVAVKRGIQVALGRRVQAPLKSVPELTMAMMLSLVHHLPQAQIEMRNGNWPSLLGRTLSGRTLGILGLGRHGSRVAQIARSAFNMNVVAWERPGSQKVEGGEYKRIPLEELLSKSDIVSVHLRLSPESVGLLDSERFKQIKEGSILINTARGAILDEIALVNALKSKRLAGAGLDVFGEEPLSKDSPLRSFPNVLLTPHIGWTVEEVFEEFAEIASIQLMQFLRGELPESELLK